MSRREETERRKAHACARELPRVMVKEKLAFARQMILALEEILRGKVWTPAGHYTVHADAPRRAKHNLLYWRALRDALEPVEQSANKQEAA